LKIDTGSDVSLLNRKLINKNFLLEIVIKYPREKVGEKVIVDFQVVVKVEVGKHSIFFPMFVATINDDCLLGIDFLKKINLGNIFDNEFSELG